MNNSIKVLKQFYECGGKKAVKDYFDIDLKPYAKKYNWTEKDKGVRGRLKKSPFRRLIARVLYEKMFFSYKKIGNLFGGTILLAQKIAYEDSWNTRNDPKIAQRAVLNLEKHKDYIIKEYRKGRFLEDLANEFGCKSRGPVTRVLEDWGILWRCYEPTIQEVKKVINLYTNRLTGSKAIAKKLSLRHSIVIKILKQNGIPIRNQIEANRIIAERTVRKNLLKKKHYAIKNGVSKSDFTKHVRILSNIFYKDFTSFINPNKIPRILGIGALDHLYSIYDAYYKKGFNFWEICHPGNLYVIRHPLNACKKHKSLSVDLVKRRIRQFENTYAIYLHYEYWIPLYLKELYDFEKVINNEWYAKYGITGKNPKEMIERTGQIVLA